MAKKGKPMATALRSFLKKHGRFPKKGELSRTRSKARRKARKGRKKGFVFTKARKAALRKAQRARHGGRSKGRRGRRTHTSRRTRTRRSWTIKLG